MKIDTTQIDGYADMSAEDKLAALESLNLKRRKHRTQENLND